MRKHWVVWGIVAVLALVFISGCRSTTSTGSAGSSNSLKIEGSNTVQPIAQGWKDAFNKLHTDVNITVGGSGTGTGVKALIDGTADICNASREMKPEEAAQAKSKGFDPFPTQIALDGIAIAVNSKNPVKQLTVEQLRNIYLGKIKDWKDVGGNPGQIVLISRDSSSGTHDFFKDHVLNKQEFAKGTLFQQSTTAEVQELSNNEKAIAYGGLAYFENKPELKVLNIAKDTNSPAITPSIATIQSREYVLSRPLFMYTRGNPAGAAAQFIEFGLSQDGQKLVETAGYVPLKR